MNYLKYTPYAYLLAAAFFIFDGYSKYMENDNSFWISLLFSALAIFVFFFRQRYAKKFAERSKRMEENGNS